MIDERWDTAAWVVWVGMVVGLASLAIGGGCASVDLASTQAATTAAANWGHANDVDLSLGAREVGEVNAVAWEVQHYLLTDEWRNESARKRTLDLLGLLCV